MVRVSVVFILMGTLYITRRLLLAAFESVDILSRLIGKSQAMTEYGIRALIFPISLFVWRVEIIHYQL